MNTALRYFSLSHIQPTPFSVHLSADLGTECTTPKCQKEFQGGCGPLSNAKRSKTAERPISDFRGSCQPATGFLKISHRKPAATKQQGNKGSEVPIIWSKVDVDAGLKITKRQSARHNERKQKQGIGSIFGGHGVREPMTSKENRVCNKLLEKDDQLVRSGIARSRFKLYKRLTSAKSELGETSWKLVKGRGNDQTYGCHVRTSSLDHAKSACKLQTDSSPTASQDEGVWDGTAWVHDFASRPFTYSRTW